MLNHYDFGGYLIWKMPQHKVFIDGRLEMYLGQVGKDYLILINGGSGYNILLDKYKIDFLLVHNTDPIVGAMLVNKNWRFVHASEKFAVFVRNTSKNAPVIHKYWSKEKEKTFALQYLDYIANASNNFGLEQIKRGNIITALQYFEAAIQYKPDYLIAHLNFARALMQAGWWNEAENEYKQILKLDPGNEIAQKNLEQLKVIKVHDRLKFL